MHTATRLAGPVIAQGRGEINPSARVCAYGLYAPLNGDWLRSLGVDAVFGGEFEEELTTYADGVANGGSRERAGRGRSRGFTSSCPIAAGCRRWPSTRRFTCGDGRQKVVGSTEASRGCKHLCRHCPVVPIYQRAVPRRAAGRRAGRYRRAGRRPAPSTSRSAIPISSTVRRTRCGSWTRCTPRIPTSPTT